MFKTIEEGLNVYKQMVRKYIISTDKMKKVYGEVGLLSWSRDDYTYVMQWTATFKAIEKVLGISREEAKEIEEKIVAEIDEK